MDKRTASLGQWILKRGVGEVYLQNRASDLPRDENYAPITDIKIMGLCRSSRLYRKLSRDTRVSPQSVAIECQWTGSRKHRVGDIINAAVQGDIGLVVCRDEHAKEICNRSWRYLTHHGILNKRRRAIIVTQAEFKSEYF